MVSVADAMSDLVEQGGVAAREKLLTVYSGMVVESLLAADSHRAARRAELGYLPEHVVIGKIARLFHLKGHDDVIAAAKEVIHKNPLVRFLFIGDGLLRDSLQQQIDASGLQVLLDDPQEHVRAWAAQLQNERPPFALFELLLNALQAIPADLGGSVTARIEVVQGNVQGFIYRCYRVEHSHNFETPQHLLVPTGHHALVSGGVPVRLALSNQHHVGLNRLATASAFSSSVSKAIFCASMMSP